MLSQGCRKFARMPFPKAADQKTKQPLEIIHTDFCGPMSTTTPGGNKYFMTMIDDYSCFKTVYLLKAKSEAASKIKYDVLGGKIVRTKIHYNSI